MARAKHALWVLMLLAACSGNPFVAEEGDGTDTGTDGGTTDGGGTGGIDGEGTYPPGTANPTASRKITRFEPAGEDGESTSGNGRVSNVSYDADSDTFSVDGLAFDGDRPYRRGRAVSGLGGANNNRFAVYEARVNARDPLTGENVPQFGHRAIYGVSRSGNTKFAIVRSRDYADYGFGGFIYQREGGVRLPTSGQATYRGDYAAVRDFSGSGGAGFATGRAQVSIDFDDFNDGAGVSGRIYNRRYIDLNGTDITDEYLALLTEDTGTRQTALPVIHFAVGPGVMDRNGEILGEVSNSVATEDGARVHETGRYYAIVSGRDAEEIVGIVVTEADYPTVDSVQMRETGGFIVYRTDAD